MMRVGGKAKDDVHWLIPLSYVLFPGIVRLTVYTPDFCHNHQAPIICTISTPLCPHVTLIRGIIIFFNSVQILFSSGLSRYHLAYSSPFPEIYFYLDIKSMIWSWKLGKEAEGRSKIHMQDGGREVSTEHYVLTLCSGLSVHYLQYSQQPSGEKGVILQFYVWTEVQGSSISVQDLGLKARCATTGFIFFLV